MSNLHVSLLTLNGKLTVGQKEYRYAPLDQLNSLGEWRKLPYSLKILLENLWRNVDGSTVTQSDLQAIVDTVKGQEVSQEIAFRPARVLMQDFTGVPAIVDLAAMRDKMILENKDPSHINPQIPVDLVIDHSVMMDHSASHDALAHNVELEFTRNLERYKFLKWGTKTFENFRVVPPGVGICHQVNLEFLAKCVWTHTLDDGQLVAYPDTVVGTDSHTTMVNGLSVLGWGVGGIEAEAAMLGQPISMLIPKVLGVHLKGDLPLGCTATDLVLTITQVLRKKGVVGMFVEYFGRGVDHLSLADRATIANMAPEYGATCGIFGIDDETLRYMALTGRSDEEIELVEKYAKAQCLWRHPDEKLSYHEVLEIDLSSIVPSVAGPKRPQDRLGLTELKDAAAALVPCLTDLPADLPLESKHHLNHHDVVLAAITSCTNTSNPAVLIAAGLVARNARALGMTAKPWVKTSFAPGSQVVGDYLQSAGLMNDLEHLGFHIAGYGCTTCIGNSGPLDAAIVQQIEDRKLTVAGVLSGNRNFEGRIHPHIKANYLASPPLVVAFAIAGTTHIDLTNDPIGQSSDGKDVYLKDIWPAHSEIQEILKTAVLSELFKTRYAHVFEGDDNWRQIDVASSQVYPWDHQSTYIQNPPYFVDAHQGASSITMPKQIKGDIKGARILALLGDSITTDHISPAGSIKQNGPAGLYLSERGVPFENFNSYGARRGNHEVMMRGTFANIRMQNEQVPERTGGFTRNYDSNSPEPISIFDAALQYMHANRPLVVIAGREYGTGSSRDWAAKGVRLLGVSAVIAESFERIHRSNLVGMGILPLVFENGVNRKTLGLVGDEIIDIDGFDHQGTITPGMTLNLHITKKDGSSQKINVLCRVDTADEVEYMNAGGILQYVLKQQS